MRRFYCQCGQEIFFENTYCNACGTQLGFDPKQQMLFSLENNGNNWQRYKKQTQQFRFCAHRHHEMACNWLIDANSTDQQCMSCQLTRKIPNQTNANNVRRWSILESAKRRMIYGLLRLNLPIPSRDKKGAKGLVFDFLEDQRSNPEIKEKHINSGHKNGVITMNVAEADGSYREATREAMNEAYRSLLGHFRHEIGHFYFSGLILNTVNYNEFELVFGDSGRDYQAALKHYYNDGPATHWQQHFISAYASSHPLEDWAETWAHYMLMSETVETAVAFGVVPMVDSENHFDVWINVWLQLVVVMNALNRSIGNSDAYPFVVTETVRSKLKFIHELVYVTDHT